MSEEKGIKELKELIIFFAVLGSAVDKSTKDGFSVEDIGAFLPAFMAAPDAFSGFKDIPAEAKDLSSDELDELTKCLAEKLDLENDKLEGIIEESLGMVVKIVALASKFKDLREKVE